MKDQVTSIGQSHWLLKLGVPAEKASLRYERWSSYCMAEDGSVVPVWGEWTLAIGRPGRDAKNYEAVPAFTVADLLEMLPQKIRDDRGNVCALCINMPRRLCWFSGKSVAGLLVAQPLVDLLVAAVEWVLSNGYKLNV